MQLGNQSGKVTPSLKIFLDTSRAIQFASQQVDRREVLDSVRLLLMTFQFIGNPSTFTKQLIVTVIAKISISHITVNGAELIF